MGDAQWYESNTMEPGADIEVRCRFDNRWVGGFIVAEVASEEVWVTRRSDGQRLPAPFPPSDVRSPAVMGAARLG